MMIVLTIGVWLGGVVALTMFEHGKRPRQDGNW
jgi:hypothetical protein